MDSAGSSKKFQKGDLVWAKMKPWPEWPGVVSAPPKDEKPPNKKYPSYWIFFFGSNNYGWVTENCLWPYAEYREQFSVSKKRGKHFTSAIEEAEKKIIDREAGQEDSSSCDSEGTVSDSSDDEPVVVPIPSTSSGSGKKFSKVAAKRKVESKFGKNMVTSTPKSPRLQTPGLDLTEMLDMQPSVVISPVPSHNQDLENEKLMKTGTPSISTRKLKYGILGLGILGKEIASRLLNTKHHVTVWNRTSSKCKEFVSMGAMEKSTAVDVFSSCDITLCCLSSQSVVKELVFKECGLLSGASKDRSLVMFTTMEPDSSVDISEAMTRCYARYLEAPVCRSVPKTPDDPSLVILAAGNDTLFADCSSMFSAIANNTLYLGSVGNASKVSLVLSTFTGSVIAAFAEGMALADTSGLAQDVFLNLLEVSSMNAHIFNETGKAMVNKHFPTKMPLQHLQKNMSQALSLAADCNHSMPVAAAANAVYVYAKKLGYGEHDVSAVYLPARF